MPGRYSMLSFGMAVAGRPDLAFYTQIRPISDEYDPRALAVSGLARDRLLSEAPPPEEAMGAAAAWVNGLRRIGRPVFLAAPAVWDGMFVHWYFMTYLGKGPFGATGSGIDLDRFDAPELRAQFVPPAARFFIPASCDSAHNFDDGTESHSMTSAVSVDGSNHATVPPISIAWRKKSRVMLIQEAVFIR